MSLMSKLIIARVDNLMIHIAPGIGATPMMFVRPTRISAE